MTQRVLGIIVGVFIIGASLVAGKAAGPVGSFVLCLAGSCEAVAPQPGDTISFDVTISGLPQNGGASVDGWVELTCEQNGVVVAEGVQPAWMGQDSAPPTFALSFVGDATCEAHLFWDGWNGPRRRKTNTLASMYFRVATPIVAP
jgi:hypothetical protein